MKKFPKTVEIFDEKIRIFGEKISICEVSVLNRLANGSIVLSKCEARSRDIAIEIPIQFGRRGYFVTQNLRRKIRIFDEKIRIFDEKYVFSTKNPYF